MSDRRVVNLQTSEIAQPAEVLTPDVARLIFAASYAPVVSPEVLPYGMETGGVATPGTGNNAVDVSAGTAVMADNVLANSAGRISVASATVTITRPSSGVRYNAIVVNASGAYAQVQGTDHTEFSAVYGDPGGPPLVGDDEVLVALVRLDSTSAAPITAGEILQFPAATLVSRENFDFPQIRDPAANFARTVAGEFEFRAALPAIHDDGTSVPVTRRVILRGSEPVFTRINYISTYTPSELSVSSSSTDTFDGPIATQSRGVSNGSFEIAQMRDGIRDAIVAAKGRFALVQFFDDELIPDVHIWDQGDIVLSRTFGATSAPTATVTIAARSPSVEVTG